MLLSAMIRLLIVSYLLLFSEIMAIRWLSAELVILRTFPNLLLMVIFISTSIGILTRNKQRGSYFLIGFCSLATIGLALSSHYLGLFDAGLKPDSWLKALTIIGFVTANLSIIFTAIGRELGVEFERMPALRSYSINLLGSILGTISFGAISFFSLPPFVWLIICGSCVYFLSPSKLLRNLVLIMALVAIIPTAYIYRNAVWSPYGKIEIVADKASESKMGNYILLCNGDFYHTAYDLDSNTNWLGLSRVYQGAKPSFEGYKYSLNLPYLLKPSPKSVLVLGAGSGNDVKCALMHGAETVDAVEINPVIAKCGFSRHPNRPYLDPRVSVFVEDARTFLRYTNKKYDLIQFAYLDPGSTLRANAFLRTDNFVYTSECLASCLKHLNPSGAVALSFATGSTAPATRRLYSTIFATTGKKPLALVQDSTSSCLFVFGQDHFPLLSSEFLKEAGVRYWPLPGEYSATRPANDDWPFLYLEFHSKAAIILYFVVLLCATLGPLWLARKNFEAKILSRESLSMFFLGLAFMLMETKSITQLSLLFGSTWIVTAIVVFVFIMLAFFANLFVSWRRSQSMIPIYIGLTLAFIVNLLLWQVPESSTINPLLFAGSTAFIACLPVLFGGMMFSTLLKKSEGQSNLLGANLLGTAFGGLLEYVCIWAGLKSLTVIAMIIYGLAIIALNFLSKKSDRLKLIYREVQ